MSKRKNKVTKENIEEMNKEEILEQELEDLDLEDEDDEKEEKKVKKKAKKWTLKRKLTVVGAILGAGAFTGLGMAIEKVTPKKRKKSDSTEALLTDNEEVLEWAKDAPEDVTVTEF